MSQFYFDTSAIVKCYHDEPGSDWVRQIINAREPDGLSRTHSIYPAEIAIAETAAAFAVLERTKRIRKPARDAMYREFLRDVANNYVTAHIRREEIDRAAELLNFEKLMSALTSKKTRQNRHFRASDADIIYSKRSKNGCWTELNGQTTSNGK